MSSSWDSKTPIQGDTPDGLYLVAAGGVRVIRHSADAQVALATFEPGDCFGEMGVIDGKPRTAMLAWKDQLTDEQRQDVLAYIRTLVRFYKPPPQQPHDEPH